MVHLASSVIKVYELQPSAIFNMKLLESSNFEAINSALFVDTVEAKIVGRY